MSHQSKQGTFYLNYIKGNSETIRGGCSLTDRALTAGYYWPTMCSDSTNHVKCCDSCQSFAKVSHFPPKQLKLIISPWPFMKWGMDIVGKLPTAPSQRVYMLAVTDYFTKWVEAEAYHQACGKEFHLEECDMSLRNTQRDCD